MSTIAELLQKAHLKKFKDIDYPESTSEDFLVRLAYADDGINEWEKEAKNGVYWPVLKSTASIASGGTGTDANETDFLEFIRAEESPAVISDGQTKWTEVSMKDGNRMAQENLTPYVFWIEGGNIRTLPAISGTITFPYLRKATRYPLGTEGTELELNEKFLEEFVIAQMFLDDKNFNAYQIHLQVAKDILDNDKYQEITEKPTETDWGFGQ